MASKNLYVYDWDYDSNATVARYPYLGAGKGYGGLDFPGALNNLAGTDIIAWAWCRPTSQQDGTGGYGRTNRCAVLSVSGDANTAYNGTGMCLAFGIIAASSTTNNMGFWGVRGKATTSRVESNNAVITTDARNKNWLIVYWYDSSADDIRIFYANDSDSTTVQEATLTVDAAGSGAVSNTAVRLAVGNTTDLQRTFDGPIMRAGLIETTDATEAQVTNFINAHLLCDVEPTWSTLAEVTLGTSPATYVAYYGGGATSGGGTTNKLGTVPGVTQLAWEDDGPNGWDLYTDDTNTDNWQCGPWATSRADDTGHTQPLTVAFPDQPLATITAPARYSVWQRNDVSSRTSGTSTKTFSGFAVVEHATKDLQARWAGGTWTTLLTAPYSALDTFTDVPITSGGPGRILEFRQGTDTPSAVVFDVACGDMFLMIGQSNMLCLGGNSGAPTTGVPEDFGLGTWVGQFFTGAATDGTHGWDKFRALPQDPAQHDTNDPSRSSAATQDNIWPRAFAELMQKTGVPVGFTMIARVNQGIGGWRRGYTNTDGGNDLESPMVWDTTWNSSNLQTFHEEAIQRAQQILGISNGTTPDYYATHPTTLHGVFRAVIVHGGERDAVGAIGLAAWQTRFEQVLADLEQDLGIVECVVGQIGKYAYVTWDGLHEIREAIRTEWGTVAGTAVNVKRGPTTYHLNITDDGTDDVHFNSSDGTLLPYSRLWTLALWDALYASDADEHRGLVIQSFSVLTATTARIEFGEALNSEGHTLWDGIRCYLNGSLLTPTASTPTAGQRRITQSGTHLDVECASGTDLGGADTLTLDIGYRNASSGGEELPHKTVTFTDA